MTNHWTINDMPDQRGKLAIVTGANSGLGYETSRGLAMRGAQVIMACRNLEKGEEARQALLQETPDAQLTVMRLDLADLASVRQFAADVRAEHDQLHILCNNAGVMALPYRQTVDGFEMQLGVNHLGHFALTGLLMPLLLATPGARVVTVSSMMHARGDIDFEDLNSERSYRKWGAYAQSKLANLLFAYELERRLEAAGDGVISVAAHPGYASTNLQNAAAEMEGSRLSKWGGQLMSAVLAQSAAMGALPTLYAATMADVRGGEYYGPNRLKGARGYPAKTDSNARSHDEALAARLWRVSEELTGVTYSL